MIGLAARAGKVQTGSEGAAHALRRNNARLVLLAADTAEDTTRKSMKLCEQAGVPVRKYGTKAELGHWTGHEERAVAAILDDGFASRIVRLIDEFAEQAGSGQQQDERTTLGG